MAGPGSPAAMRPAAPASGGGGVSDDLGDFGHWLIGAIKGIPGLGESLYDRWQKGITKGGSLDPVSDIVAGLTGGRAKPKAKAAAKKPDPAEGLTAAQIEAQIKADPWSQISQGLVAEMKGDIGTPANAGPVEAAVSGLTGPAAINQAEQTALALTGTQPGSAGAQWLAANLQAGQEAAQPLEQAMQQYGGAYAALSEPVEAALNAYGQANAAYVATAPEQSWLQALQSHITSNLSYYGEIPTADKGALSPAVLYALQQSGGYPGSSSSGLTSLANLGVKNGQVVQAPGQGNNPLGSNFGSVPGTSQSPSPGA